MPDQYNHERLQNLVAEFLENFRRPNVPPGEVPGDEEPLGPDLDATHLSGILEAYNALLGEAIEGGAFGLVLFVSQATQANDLLLARLAQAQAVRIPLPEASLSLLRGIKRALYLIEETLPGAESAGRDMAAGSLASIGEMLEQAVDRSLQALEIEIDQLNRQIRATSETVPKVALMKAVRKKDGQRSRLRAAKRGPREWEDYFLWLTNHQMRVQSESGEDPYTIFNSAWLDAVTDEVPDLEQFMRRLETELGLDSDFIQRLAQEEAGGEAWHAVRRQGA